MCGGFPNFAHRRGKTVSGHDGWPPIVPLLLTVVPIRGPASNPARLFCRWRRFGDFPPALPFWISFPGNQGPLQDFGPASTERSGTCGRRSRERTSTTGNLLCCAACGDGIVQSAQYGAPDTNRKFAADSLAPLLKQSGILRMPNLRLKRFLFHRARRLSFGKTKKSGGAIACTAIGAIPAPKRHIPCGKAVNPTESATKIPAP